jgi:hypothetical protein
LFIISNYGNRHARDEGTRFAEDGHLQLWRIKMGKYVLGWLLGVPTIVLVILYLLFN